MHADYGFRVMIYLALSADELVQIRTISDSYRISENHLIKVVQKLSKLGYIETIRGRRGGIRLALSPDQINLGEVYRNMEPSLNLLECFDPAINTCPIIGICGLNHAFKDALDAFLHTLDQLTLSSILPKKKLLRTHLGI